MAVGNAVFHLKRSRVISRLFVLAVLCALVCGPAWAEVSDEKMASHIATLLGGKFTPESLEVTVNQSCAYAEMRGVVLSGIRIDTMRLDALLTNDNGALGSDVDSLASLIGYSKGEIVLLERDVNNYFANNNTKGFSNLVFNFTPKGFRADGIFSADFLFTLRVRLAAEGVLGLRSEGLYLEDVSIYVEKIKQPSALTNQIVNRVNPLLKWSDIPFKVEFRTVTIDDEATRMTGGPERLESGFKVLWPGENQTEELP
ncbi:MAG: DUF2993 domain-containing protein [Synergistaceae bacterium]|nr:DUF2993 domain-containing protein [Synergistaceae bacterium]